MGKGLGSGDNGEFTFLDTIGIISFVVGLQNLGLNVSQENLDKQTMELKEQVDAKVELALSEIHKHLEEQDRKIDIILEVLRGEENM